MSQSALVSPQDINEQLLLVVNETLEPYFRELVEFMENHTNNWNTVTPDCVAILKSCSEHVRTGIVHSKAARAPFNPSSPVDHSYLDVPVPPYMPPPGPAADLESNDGTDRPINDAHKSGGADADGGFEMEK